MRDGRTSVCLSAEDAAYFQTFYAANRRRLMYFVRQKGVPEEDVMDLVHDASERLMKNIPALRKYETEPGKQTYYIRLTVESVCVDRYRAGAKLPYDTYPPEELDTISGVRQARKHTPQEEISENIEIARKAMSEQQWRLASGKYMMGYSDEELAKKYGYSKDSIRTVLSRAFKKARVALQGKGGESDGSKK